MESEGRCGAPAECTRAVHKRGASIEAITRHGDRRFGFYAKFLRFFSTVSPLAASKSSRRVGRSS
ncbi:hypothetical protein AK973_4299 [Pseudomonas brassicacearum]|nr:hypothetical protein AK973_4299 [Pseudomonas brassicacearum]